MLVLVLVQPHASVGVVQIHDAEVGIEVHADVARDPAGQSAELLRNRRHRQAVEVGARRLVGVRLPVPVPSQAEHADVHPSAAAHDRHVAWNRAVHECPAAIEERALLVER